METTKDKQKNRLKALKEFFPYTNLFEAPRIEKVVISTGTGSINDKEKLELIPDRLMKIAGQKPAPRAAKQSIASFKVREGNTIGYAVTLRGDRMNKFIDKLINVALPRTRDFKGIDRKAIDEIGNLTIGIREHTIFPETADEELKNVFGFSITFVTTAKNREEAEKLFEYIGIPFKKKEEK